MFTGFYDRSGIPIHVGDLIRVEHYTHYRNRRKMYLYFRVAIHPKFTKPECVDSRYVVQNWSDLDPTKCQCLLRDCGLKTCDVLAESQTHRDERGQIMTFNERKRV